MTIPFNKLHGSRAEQAAAIDALAKHHDVLSKSIADIRQMVSKLRDGVELLERTASPLNPPMCGRLQ